MKSQSFFLTSGVWLGFSLGLTGATFAQQNDFRFYGSTTRDVHVRAAVGTTVRVWGSVNFSNHCSPTLATTMTVTQPPAHGSTSVRDRIVKQGSPDFAGECKNHSGQGKLIYYTRTSPGVDHFKFTSSSLVGGVDHNATVD